jgi:cell division inhibitor SepF
MVTTTMSSITTGGELPAAPQPTPRSNALALTSDFGADDPFAGTNVIGMPGLSTAAAEVTLMEPRSFDEMPRAIQALRERKTVILNLTMMDPDQAQRAVDFVAGGTFAIDGHQERVGESIFLFAPSCVTVTTSGGEEVTSPTMVTNTATAGLAESQDAAPSPAWGRQEMASEPQRSVSAVLGVVGLGRMAQALLQPWLEQGLLQPSQVSAVVASAQSAARLQERFACPVGTDPAAAWAAGTVLLAVKPQQLEAVAQVAPEGCDRLLVSVLAGVPLARLQQRFPGWRCVRAVPNTPALVRAGLTALAYGEAVQAGERQWLENLFAAVGEVWPLGAIPAGFLPGPHQLGACICGACGRSDG